MPSSFDKFIVENAEAEVPRLLLSSVQWPVPDDPDLSAFDGKQLAISTIESRKKLRDKVPEWYSITSLVYPASVSAEQCSSSVTAAYKASLLARILEGASSKSVADLTGGLGVDSWAFSHVSDKVLYNEMDHGLASAARHNFRELGSENIHVVNLEIKPGGLGDVLGSFKPDVIFLDPARRDSAGGKVFLLEDCSPNVLELVPELFSYSRNILLKLSPMVDISMVVERLNRAYESHLESRSGDGWNGNWVREIHVVASGGECKELLVWMDREWSGEYVVTCREDGGSLSCSSEEIRSAKAILPEAVDFKYIFEPGKSLAKAGVFNVLCSRFGLVKLARSTNLFSFPFAPFASRKDGALAAKGAFAPYASCKDGALAAKGAWAPYASRPIRVNVRPGALPPEPSPVTKSAPPVILSEAKDLFPLGKIYEVTEIVRMNKAGMRDIGRRFPRSEVSAKNIPLSSSELRSRLGVKSGDDAHIFGVRIETPFQADNFLLVCHRI